MMCDAERQLQRAVYELDLQRGNGVWNLGRIREILTTEHENCGDNHVQSV